MCLMNGARKSYFMVRERFPRWPGNGRRPLVPRRGNASPSVCQISCETNLSGKTRENVKIRYKTFPGGRFPRRLHTNGLRFPYKQTVSSITGEQMNIFQCRRRQQTRPSKGFVFVFFFFLSLKNVCPTTVRYGIQNDNCYYFKIHFHVLFSGVFLGIYFSLDTFGRRTLLGKSHRFHYLFHIHFTITLFTIFS